MITSYFFKNVIYEVILYKKEFFGNIFNNILMNFDFIPKFNNLLIEILEKIRQKLNIKKDISFWTAV